MIKRYYEYNESVGDKFISKFKNFFKKKDKAPPIVITEDDVIDIKQILNHAKDQGIGTNISPLRVWGIQDKLVERSAVHLINPYDEEGLTDYRFGKEEFKEICAEIGKRLEQIGIFEKPIYYFNI